MFLCEELACGVAVTKTTPVDKLEKQPSLGSLVNQADQDSESVEGKIQWLHVPSLIENLGNNNC